MASDDAKPASPPAAADPPAADAEDAADPDPAAPADGKEETTPQQPEKKRGRRKKGEAQAEAAKKTPPLRKSGPAAERPSRERKTVERYSELAKRVVPVKKSPAILQGSGTKLKDIPNVSFKLSKRKADDILQRLHVLMYGKKSNVHFLKRNISQFSGFVWTDNQEKQRTKIKEKLDKFNKEKLLDFCEILDILLQKQLQRRKKFLPKSWSFWSPLLLLGMLFSLITRKGRNVGGDLREVVSQLLKVLLKTRKRKGARTKQLKLGKRVMLRKMLVLTMLQQERKVMRDL